MCRQQGVSNTHLPTTPTPLIHTRTHARTSTPYTTVATVQIRPVVFQPTSSPEGEDGADVRCSLLPRSLRGQKMREKDGGCDMPGPRQITGLAGALGGLLGKLRGGRPPQLNSGVSQSLWSLLERSAEEISFPCTPLPSSSVMSARTSPATRGNGPNHRLAAACPLRTPMCTKPTRTQKNSGQVATHCARRHRKQGGGRVRMN